MPFGLCNGPSTFRRLMQVVLAGLEWECCFMYIGDILVCSRTFRDHLDHLKQVFDRLRQANLCLKPKKCFLQKLIHYLGYISQMEIASDDGKVEKIDQYPPPRDTTQARVFGPCILLLTLHT